MVIDFDGKDMDIFGTNGAGKTTIFDAFTWTLFGKSSTNVEMKDQVKLKDEKGHPSIDHGLEHEVELILELDSGKPLQLKRNYHEKWKRISGAAQATFSTHTTDFEVDNVPVSAKQFTELINKIIPEEVFRLITSPFYFNSLHWQDRRKILIEVCGDVSDHDVIAGNKNLQELELLLGDHSLEDFRAILLAQKTKINKEIEKLPVRIDEVQRGLPDIEGILLESVLNTEIESLRKQQSEVSRKIVQIQSGGAVAAKEKQIAEIEAQQIQIKNKYDHEINKEALLNESLKAGLEQKKARLQSATNDYKKRADAITACITKTGAEIVSLRKRWDIVDEEIFTASGEDICPTCGQHLPADQIEATNAKLLEAFNLDKANRLKEINESGKKKKAQMEADAAQIEGITKDINANEAKLVAIDDEIKALESKATTIADYHNDGTYVVLENQKEDLESEIKELKAGNNEEIRKLNDAVKMFDVDIQSRQEKVATLQKHQAGEDRIKELEVEQSKLSASFEKIEHQIFLTNEFIQTKVSIMEEKINSKFKLARFKLFETQINGGLKECCETLGENGVPYTNELNTGGTYNTGLDIINTLSEFYKAEAPVFIDGSESVTDLIPMKSQVIRLVVSKADQVLRIETAENELQEAM